MFELKNILRCTLVISIYLCGKEGVFAQSQIELFNNFANESWKSKKISIGEKEKTIEQHIVDAFNENQWGPGASNEKIDKQLNRDIKDYYQTENNPLKWTNNLDINDSPRQWMDKLDLREIYRFKDLINQNSQLIDNRNWRVDDLVKARALSGVFWIVDSDGAERSFSGMLIPGQSFDENEFKIYTCGHGFTEGNENNGVSYYFVPYGVAVTCENTEANYIKKKGFKVNKIKCNGEQIFTAIDADYFKKERFGEENQYSKNDYAEVVINGRNLNGRSLQEELQDAGIGGEQLRIITDDSMALPSWTLSNPDLSADSQEEPPATRLFVVGLASQNELVWDNSDLIVSTTIINDNEPQTFQRSLNNDQNIQEPEYIGNINEISTSLATYYGMSGGPIIRCKLYDDGKKICESVIGTLWGGEREFNDERKIKKFGCFVNKCP